MSAPQFGPALDELREKVHALDDEVSAKLKEFKAQLDGKLGITSSLEEASSRSWAGYHASLYYKDFQKPPLEAMFNPEWGGLFKVPEGWAQHTNEDVAAYVEKAHGGTPLTEIETFVESIVSKVAPLKSDVCSELSPITTAKGYEREVELLDHLEKLRAGISASDYVKQRIPATVATRDSKAIFQGIGVPPHVWYQARVLSALSAISAVEDFFTTAKRLIRQVEIKQNLQGAGETTVHGVEEVLRVCEKFHDVARQLRQRHEERNTLEVEDEYDAQDLLHALLRLFFNDIRAEEWTPSYAGGSSRMDFLLKRERIVVEVK